MSRINLSHRQAEVVVVGAGAAGLMASIVAAEAGAKVVLLEKNTLPGKKLRITGGGRCNITNNTPVVRELLSVYKDAGKFLFSTFSQCDVPMTRQWLADHGIPTVEEAECRVFPVSQSAEQVTVSLIAAARQAGVKIETASPVLDCCKQDGHFVVTTPHGQWHASCVILATGGTSRPETGSSGDALPWLKAFGHRIAVPHMSLVPITVREVGVVQRMAGVALPEARIVIEQAGSVVSRTVGKVLFTHVGMSGPGILNVSSNIREALTRGETYVLLDLVPHTPHDVLTRQIIDACMTTPNKLVRTQLAALVPSAIVTAIMSQALVSETVPSHNLTVADRTRMVSTIKALRFTISGLLGADKAVVSSGGVVLPEVDFRTMESRLVPGLYIVGDVLNIDRPSGGYSLQLCWTTGFVAGRHAALLQTRNTKSADHNT